MELRQKILCVLSEYGFAQANTEASIRVKTAFESIREEISSIAFSKRCRNVRISSAFNREHQSVIIPWVVLFDIKENRAQYREVYIMLLFKADMSGVYLTVNQGGGMMYSAPISVLDFLEDMEVGSIELSKEFLQLFNAGFSFDRNIDLADSGIIARTHEKATVVYKYYDRNYLPSEGEIESDISTVLYAYENFIGNSLSENLNFYEPTRKPIADNSTHTNSKLNGLETSPQEIEITQEVSHDKPVREEDFLNKQEQRAKQARDLPYDELLKRAVAPAKTDYQMVLSKRFVRNEYVARIAKSRANGKCQLCEQGAPFKDQNGEFFLEVHHIVWLSRNGKDVIENVVALCPNCHSKMHVLDLKKDKALLRRRVQPA